MTVDDRIVSVVGLGYVGLPIALAFAETRETIAYDRDSQRITELKDGFDRTGEIPQDKLLDNRIIFSDEIGDLKRANFHVVAVPTPVDGANRPDLSLLLNVSRGIGSVLKPGDIVVYESTVYPGVTEGVCVRALEERSGLKCGQDFKVGYSPERINPGDTEHSFSKIPKVVSAQDGEALEIVASVYESVVAAGVYRAQSIQVAEAAKVIENTQRDLNIALMNELAMIFDRLDIDTEAVLDTAATKWNFLKFTPGLVGGHCIGVDPYYLTHRAEEAGYIPQVILAGRRINDGMGRFIARRAVKEMIKLGHDPVGSKVTVLGLTFKENCHDIRNSKVVDLIDELSEFGIDVQVHDPFASPDLARQYYGIELVPSERLATAKMVILAVAHRTFLDLTLNDFKKMMNERPVLIDVKSILDPEAVQEAGIHLWRL